MKELYREYESLNMNDKIDDMCLYDSSLQDYAIKAYDA